MLKVKQFTFNPIQENTYIVYDETKECAIIDAGCLSPNEEDAVVKFINDNDLQLKRVINTHLHFDHCFGHAFIAKKYGLLPEAHPGDEFFIDGMVEHARSFGFMMEVVPQKLGGYIYEGEQVKVGNTTFELLHVPGHSPGSLCFYSAADKVMFTGDVLFQESIGRSDLPMGDFGTLIDGITKKILTLPDDVVIYSGHGPSTTIGHERVYNPYL